MSAFPVIDIAAFGDVGASAAERVAVARRVGDACETPAFSP